MTMSLLTFIGPILGFAALSIAHALAFKFYGDAKRGKREVA